MRKKVIIDCDVGVDDALALILAFHSPELEVMAVTGVNGNAPLELVFENIQRVLALIRPEGRPLIARGADRPLKGRPVYAHSVHGESGLGGAKIGRKEDETWWQCFDGQANELITTLARQHAGEITLIATGPLTNVALGIQEDPEGMRGLKGVISMGGAVRTKGNVTDYAEFNIFSDPVAARIVFESELPVTLVPLDVTHQVFLTPELLETRVNPLSNAFSKFVIDAIGYDMAAHQFRTREVMFLHDPLAVGVVLNPGLVKTKRLSLRVETQEGDHFGRIQEVGKGPEIDVCLEVDAKGFLELFLERLGRENAPDVLQ
ncbi:MAG: nucleoside hydrolase [Deltaproteobacteria bacterium]|nr:MAG: nucleoside hydrolase [Deltaproteobacteria bacterium]